MTSVCFLKFYMQSTLLQSCQNIAFDFTQPETLGKRGGVWYRPWCGGWIGSVILTFMRWVRVECDTDLGVVGEVGVWYWPWCGGWVGSVVLTLMWWVMGSVMLTLMWWVRGEYDTDLDVVAEGECDTDLDVTDEGGVWYWPWCGKRGGYWQCKGITVFKMFIWGGISPVIWSVMLTLMWWVRKECDTDLDVVGEGGSVILTLMWWVLGGVWYWSWCGG